MKVAALLLVWLAWPGPAAAVPAGRGWAIDAAQSRVTFTVSRFWVTRVRGIFPGLSGTLRRDPTPGADLGRVEASVEVEGLEMGDAGARSRALGAEFFDARRYPAIRFVSDPFPLTELVTGGELPGRLTLHGVERPVRLVLEASTCPGEPLYCVIRLRGAVARGDFGMHAMRGILGEKVQLDLRILLRDVP
ncbi:MAG TPA: YceI family protein [Rhodanobacteraceae bacterium]|nr:YceI family protein [Rhodanobacteraceae bacterium]